jgi:outer membrane protein TolC
VDAAYLNVSSLLRQRDANEAAVRTADTALPLIREGYRAGQFSVREVLDAQAVLAQARSALVLTTNVAQAALAQLPRATGEEGP